MNGSQPRTKRSPSPAIRLLRRLHRWLGVGAACFLLLLAGTGLALNHAERFGLDTQFIGAGWLLDWYGISGPEFGPSFSVAGRRITEAGERLYLDQQPVEFDGGDRLIGAVALGDEIVVATASELVMLNGLGELVDRVPAEQSVAAPIAAIGLFDDGVALLAAGRVYRVDQRSFSIVPAGQEPGASGSTTGAGVAAPVTWVAAEPLPDAIRSGIEASYRGQGLAIERVLTDLHSGRLLGIGGVAIMDLAALALVYLAVSGIIMWLKR